MNAEGALPSRLLPVLYFGLAHLSLTTAFAAMVMDPAGVAGFFYQPRTIGIVHLVTLGWISASILGALYVIGPLALRMPLPAGGVDYAAFALVAIGTSGMAGHFFIARYAGAAWSGGLALAGILIVALRVLPRLVAAPVQEAVKLHAGLAFGNVLLAGLMGIALAVHKEHPFLPGPPLGYVFAHLHVAALGWAGMMVLGVGYRMMPMILPAAMPPGRSLHASAVLLEAGILGLVAGFLLGDRLLPPSALLAAAGFAAFLLQVRWMLANRRRRPPWLRLPDYGLLHVLASILYVVLGAVLGVTLSILPQSDRSLRAAAAYGVAGLLGFLGQMVLGMLSRVLPMLAVCHANRGATCDAPPVTPREMGIPGFPAAIFVLWSAGVPLLAAGMFLQAAPAAGAGGAVMFAASVLQAFQAADVLRHAFRRPRGGGPALQ